MAKPIRATPKLNKEESKEFIKNMVLIENSKINEMDKKLSQQIKLNSKFFEICQVIPKS